jgi:enoyl-CoA hydratase/carnithine racemase
MPDIRTGREGALLVLTLERGKANALNAAMVEGMHGALDEAADQAVRGLVLASISHKVFCAGFDVVEVFAYERPKMTAYMRRFIELLDRLRTLPKPVIAAMSGHAYAGGALMALMADVRIMAEGFNIAINEVDLGVALPARLIRAMTLAAGRPAMQPLLLGGEAITASRAHAIGLVSEIVPAIDVLPVAMTRARQLADKPAVAFALHKQALDAAGGMPSEAERDAEVEQLLDVWFGKESTRRRAALIERLSAKP